MTNVMTGRTCAPRLQQEWKEASPWIPAALIAPLLPARRGSTLYGIASSRQQTESDKMRCRSF
jgi:hypothetical protein